MNNFEKFNEIQILAKEYIKGRIDRFDFINLSNIDVVYNGLQKQDQSKIKNTLNKVISKNNGEITESINGYQIFFPINNLSISTIINPSSLFEFSIYINGIEFNTNHNDNFLLFLKIINNPNLIDESNFHYYCKKIIEKNGIEEIKEIRFIEKNKSLSWFFENISQERDSEDVSIIKYSLDTILGNCFFECNKNKTEKITVSLMNPYKIEDVPLKIPTMPIEVISDFDLNEEEFKTLGFDFQIKKNSSIQDDLQKKHENQISAVKIIAENISYSAIKIGMNSITLSNSKNKYLINIFTKSNKNKEQSLLDIPFFVNIEIKNSRNFILHESFIKKHLIENYKKNEPIYFKDLCSLLDKIIKDKFDSFYFVYFCDTNLTINNETNNSGYAFDSFEDALLLENGFLDRTNNFEKIDLDCTQKYGIGYSGYNNHIDAIWNPSIYCAIAKNEKLAGFYASIIDMKNQ